MSVTETLTSQYIQSDHQDLAGTFGSLYVKERKVLAHVLIHIFCNFFHMQLFLLLHMFVVDILPTNL